MVLNSENLIWACQIFLMTTCTSDLENLLLLLMSC